MSVRVGGVGMWRQLVLAHPATLAAVLAVVAGATALATAAPQALDDALTRAGTAAVDGRGERIASVVATVPGRGVPSGATADDLDEDLLLLRESAGSVLQPRLTSGRWSSATSPAPVSETDGRLVTDPLFVLSLGTASLQEYVTWQTGRPPQVVDQGDAGADGSPRPVLEIGLSTATAETMGLRSGDVLVLGDEPVLVSGTYVVDDPDDVLWTGDASRLAGYVERDLGNRGTQIEATGLLPIELGVPGAVTYRWQVDGAVLVPEQVQPLHTDLVELAARPLPGQAGTMRPSTQLTAVLDDLLLRRDATVATAAVATSGLLAVAVGVLVLAVRLLLQRRERTVRALASRGGSLVGLGVATAVEMTVLAAPVAALALVATATLPGRVLPTTVLLAAVPVMVLLVAATSLVVRLAATSVGGGRRPGRDQAPTGRESRTLRWRPVVEAAVGVLAVVAVVLQGRTGGAGADLLTAAVPVLVPTAFALLLARLVPAASGAAARRLAVRSGLVGFVAAARAARDPQTTAAVPLIVLAVALAAAVTGGVLSATLVTGSVAAAWDRVGAPVRAVTVVAVGPEALSVARAEGEVGPLVAIAEADGEVVVAGGQREVTVLALDDADAWDRVVAQVPGGPWASAAPLQDSVGDGPPTVVVVGLGLPAGETPSTLVVGAGGRSQEVEVLLHPAEGGVPGRENGGAVPGADAGTGAAAHGEVVVLADLAMLREASGAAMPVQQVRAGVPDGADPAGPAGVAAGEAVSRSLARPGTSGPPVRTVRAELVGLRADPLLSVVRAAFPVAAVGAGTGLAVATVLVLLLGAPARSRYVSLLRTLGMDREQGRRLVGLELLPTATAALLAGVLGGLAVTIVVAPGLGLARLVGARAELPLVVDPVLLAGTVVAFAGLVASTAVVTVAVASAAGAGRVLRVGEEEQ
jgi:putative ABC transport system permease protein